MVGHMIAERQLVEAPESTPLQRALIQTKAKIYDSDEIERYRIWG